MIDTKYSCPSHSRTLRFWALAWICLGATTDLVVAQTCTNQDFSVLYDGQPYFSVSSLNGTCVCQKYYSSGSSLVGGDLTVQGSGGVSVSAGPLNLANGQTLNVGSSGTSSQLNVYGAGSVRGGLAVTGGLTVTSGGVGVANGQTVNIGTSGSATPLNVYGTATVYAGLTLSGGATVSGGVTVSSGGLTVANGNTVNIGTSGATTPLNVFGSVVINSAVQAQKIFTFVDAANDYVSVLPYFESEYSGPYPRVVNVACGTAARFPSPSIVSANEWDWGAHEAWTSGAPVPPVYAASTTAWAKITMSISSNTNHGMCLFLRREHCSGSNVCSAYSGGWVKKAGDPDISLGCYSASMRNYMASVFVWAPWWNSALPSCQSGVGCGYWTQRLLVSGETNYCPDAAGSFQWIVYNMRIELHASESGRAQPTAAFATAGVTPPGGGQFSTNTVASGTPRSDSPLRTL